MPDVETARKIAEFSRYIESTYRPGMDRELVARRRIDKLTEELGEVFEALGGMVGENPRKGVFGCADDVVRELLDVAVCALGAVEHFNGHSGDCMEQLADHASYVHQRAGLAATEAVTEPETEPLIWNGTHGVDYVPDGLSALTVVRRIKEAGGEARYEFEPHDGAMSARARIVITGPDGDVFMLPGGEAVMGEMVPLGRDVRTPKREDCGHRVYLGDNCDCAVWIREFTVRRPTGTTR